MKESNKHIYMCVTRPGIMARWDADKRKADYGEPGPHQGCKGGQASLSERDDAERDSGLMLHATKYQVQRKRSCRQHYKVPFSPTSETSQW